MEKKGKKVRKNVMIDPDLLKAARKNLGASTESETIEKALEPIAEWESEDEIMKATREFIKHLSRDKIKPIFD